MHNQFADIYDLFMKNVDYDDWYKFLRSYITKKGDILDLGCGTGKFAEYFIKDGYNVIGVDISKEMIRVANEKMLKNEIANGKYQFINDDIRNYENEKQVDYIMCNFDTINYFVNKKDLIQFFQKSNKNLNKKGYLIFDVVTEEIFEEIFENGIFLDEEPEYTSIWRYEEVDTKKYFIEIDLFVKETEDDLFRKYNEQHEKYIYEPEFIVETARKNGFEVYDVATNPAFGESRIFFVFRKVN